MNPLQDAAERIAGKFELEASHVNRIVEVFLKRMKEGLATEGAPMQQIPSFVTSFPNGSEKGTYLAVDLGGTNLRVCSVNLNGDGTYSVEQSKVAIPKIIMLAAASRELFLFIAKQIKAFLTIRHGKLLAQSQTQEVNRLSLGFTFSYTVSQQSIDSGTLIQWDKGFNIEDAIGRDVCELLQDALDELRLPVKVVALVNDTVGTLMTRAYTSKEGRRTILGAVFGTGTNGAYIEQVSNIPKLHGRFRECVSTEEMVVNAEWGGFDDALDVLPTTPYDTALDRDSVNPSSQHFEKRIAGMYLGEILRLAIVDLVSNERVPIFGLEQVKNCSFLSKIKSYICLLSGSGAKQDSKVGYMSSTPLFKPWTLDSEILSRLEADRSENLCTSRQHLQNLLAITHITTEEARAIKTIAHAIGKRSARLSGIAVGSVILHTGILHPKSKKDLVKNLDADGELSVSVREQALPQVDVGVDGSLVEFYPGFEQELRGALIDIEGLGKDGESRISIGIARDGSGVGAALTAHMIENLKE